MVALATIIQNVLIVQARFGQIVTVFVPNDLEDQRQMSPYAMPSDNLTRYTYKPNLVILGSFFQKLLSVQAKVYGRTDGRTDGRRRR